MEAAITTESANSRGMMPMESDTPQNEMHPRVLIVDDVSFVRERMRKILEGAGCVVVGEASDGDEVALLCRELKPDLITMDVNMKRMDGIEAAKGIKKEFPEIKILMVSETAQPHIILDSIHAGALNFIRKPFGEVQISRAIEKAMCNRK